MVVMQAQSLIVTDIKNKYLFMVKKKKSTLDLKRHFHSVNNGLGLLITAAVFQRKLLHFSDGGPSRGPLRSFCPRNVLDASLQIRQFETKLSFQEKLRLTAFNVANRQSSSLSFLLL
ncbi:hypothetical protein ILYODFUR_036622 [Ilyodon furcidens]|uniref:Uncharacterized protein n=1 Tax=Ilyodon furcidens TaxID=33524 RepID=A0ABV0VCI2_9TELE